MAPTAADIINGINALTSLLQKLQAPANSITIINGPLVVVGLGPIPQIVAGISQVISTAQAQTAYLSSAKSNYDDQAADIYSAVQSVSCANHL
jgi:hypothetical protein